MKEVNFKKVSIINFLSVGEDPVTIEFTKGLHVITGANRDKPDRRNAIGKSTVADSIYFAIFGDTLRELKKDLIPNNITGGRTHVELDFELKSTKGVSNYKIVRHLNPSKVFVFKDGVDKTRDSISNTNKYISQVTSATPSIFQNCVIMTVNNAIPFMAKNKIEKRKFIEDIFGMEVFGQMLSHLRSEYNDIKREHDTEFTRLEEVSKSCNNYKDQRTKILDRRKEKHALYLERKESNETELSNLKTQTVSVDRNNINNVKESIKEYEGKLNICDEKISDLIEDISTKKAEVTHTKTSYAKIGTSDEKCPVCLRNIEDHDTEHIEIERKALKEEIEAMVGDIKIVQEKLSKAKNIKLRVNQAITSSNKDLSQIKLDLQAQENINLRIDQLNKWQAELGEDIKSVNITETDIDVIIESTNKDLESLQVKVKELRERLATLDIVKYVVSEEGVKSYIVNKLLELLNNKLLQYLRRLDSNSICIFNEYFEEEILNEKNKVCSYFNFSGAERKSIDLACLFTFADIRRMQGGVKYNIAIYDELFDSSFDEKGIELITQILQDRVEELDECSIVISHRKESIKAVTGEVIWLEKENGITHRIDYTEI